MTIRNQLENGQSGRDFRDTINNAIAKQAPVFVPVVGSGDDTAAIQTAIDAAVAAGHGVVYLGNLTWNLAGSLELDAARVALRGDGAVLNFTGTRDFAIHIFSSDPSVNYGVDILECSGLIIKGVGTIDKGLFFKQPTNPQQQNASKGWSRCAIQGFNNNIVIADNAYIMSFRDCAIGNAVTNCLFRETNINNGERIVFDTCTFYNSARFIRVVGVSSDWYFNNCSFDYPTGKYMTVDSGDYVFTACHFEGLPAERPFEADNGAIVKFVACFFGMQVATDFMFTSYGQGAEFQLLGCFNGLGGTTRIFSTPRNAIVRDFTTVAREYQSLPTTGPAVTNCIASQDYYVALTGDWQLSNPINATRGTIIRWRLKAGASVRAITYDTKIKGALISSIPANNDLLLTGTYDANDDIWDVTSTLRSPIATATNMVMNYGINIFGNQGTPENLPGTLGSEVYVTPANRFSYYAGHGFDTVRIELSWERLQPSINGPLGEQLSASYPDSVNDPLRDPVKLTKWYLDQCQANGVKGVLDIHNYGRRFVGYTGGANGSWANKTMKEIGSAEVPYSALVDLWVKMHAAFGSHPALAAYEIMNEPHDLAVGEAGWVEQCKQVITALRNAGFTKPIIVGGYGWQSAHYWRDRNPTIHTLMNHDPLKNIVFAAHQYFDNTERGVYDNGQQVVAGAENPPSNPDTGVQMIQPFLDWVAQYNFTGKAIINEFGAPNTAAWAEIVRRAMVAAYGAGIGMSIHQDFPYPNHNDPQATYPTDADPSMRRIVALMKSAAGDRTLLNTVVSGSGSAGSGTSPVAHSAVTTYDGGYQNEHSISYTVPAGSDRLLVVGVYQRDVGLVTGVTFGGVAMTRSALSNNPGVCGLTIYTLVAPAVSTGNVVVSLSDYRQISATVMVMTNVDQTTPVEAKIEQGGYGTRIEASVTSLSSNAMVFQFINTEIAGTVTAGTGQTIIANADHPDDNAGQYAVSKKSLGVAGATTVYGTIPASTSWHTAALVIKPKQ